MAGLTAHTMTMVNAASDATIIASVPPAPPAVASVTTSASSDHAVTSSTAAHASAVVPSGVFVIPRSSRTRASTGNAVMLRAMPMNNANEWKGIPAGA